MDWSHVYGLRHLSTLPAVNSKVANESWMTYKRVGAASSHKMAQGNMKKVGMIYTISNSEAKSEEMMTTTDYNNSGICGNVRGGGGDYSPKTSFVHLKKE